MTKDNLRERLDNCIQCNWTGGFDKEYFLEYIQHILDEELQNQLDDVERGLYRELKGRIPRGEMIAFFQDYRNKTQ